MTKFEKYILKPKPLEEIPYHTTTEASRRRRVFVSEELLPEAKLHLMVRELVEGEEPVAVESHTHDVDQIYLFLEEGNHQIKLEDEIYSFEAPAAVYIPKGVRHGGGGRMIKGSKKRLGIVITLKGNYP